MSILKNSLCRALVLGTLGASLSLIPQVSAAPNPNILSISPEEANVVRTGRKPRPNGAAMTATLRNQREIHEDTPDPTKTYAATEANERNKAASGASSPGAKIIVDAVSRSTNPLRVLVDHYHKGSELKKVDFVRDLADTYAITMAQHNITSLPSTDDFILGIWKQVDPDRYQLYNEFRSDLLKNITLEAKYVMTSYENGNVSVRSRGILFMDKGMYHEEDEDPTFITGYHLKDRTIYFYDEEAGEEVGYLLENEASFPLAEFNRMAIDHLYLYEVKKTDEHEFEISPTSHNKCDASFVKLVVMFKNDKLYRLRFIDEDGSALSYRFTSVKHQVNENVFEDHRYE